MDEIELVPILKGERMSLPVIEPDGARIGFRMVEVPCDGFQITGIPEVSAFVPFDRVWDSVTELKKIRKNPGRYGR